MWLQPFDIHEQALDLTREQVDPSDNEHIVGATRHPLHSHMGAAAPARLRVQPGNIFRPVTDNRERFLGDGGKDQLPFFAEWEVLTCCGIDDLRNEMVLENVQPVLGLDTLH